MKKESLEGTSFETRAIHAGQEPDTATGATIVPVYQTSTFTQDGIGQHRGWEYSRGSNPTRDALEACLASLEGGAFGVAYASGMAAISGVTQLLSAGDHVVVGDDLYGGSYRLFSHVLPRFGVEFSWVDATDLEAVAAAIRAETKLLWIESPTNPMLRLIDIAACAELAEHSGCKLVVDNTFATPYLQNPLALGAHISVHSTTKYIGGHSDVIGGAVVLDDEEMHERLRFTRNATGGVPGPWDAWLTLRGVKTLALRMREHETNAARVAEYLGRRPEIARVYYPGLADHPGHELAKRQMRGFGGMVTVDFAAGEKAARRFCESTRIFSLAESLGGIESLIGYPFLMSHGAFPADEKRRKGIGEATVRLSVGIENAEDLCADLEHALERATSEGVKRAILLVDHGSRRPEANALLEAVAELLAERVPDMIVRCAHMELAQPDVAAGIAACAADGADAIVVHPYFLGPGNHTSDDIPRLVRAAAADHPDVAVRVSPPLGLHPKLIDVVLDRIREASP